METKYTDIDKDQFMKDIKSFINDQTEYNIKRGINSKPVIEDDNEILKLINSIIEVKTKIEQDKYQSE